MKNLINYLIENEFNAFNLFYKACEYNITGIIKLKRLPRIKNKNKYPPIIIDLL